MATTADYLNALIRDKNNYVNILSNLSQETIISNLSFLEANNKLNNYINYHYHENTINYYSNIKLAGCPFINIDNDLEALSRCTFFNLDYMFTEAAVENIDKIKLWDISKATSAIGMFRNCKNLTHLNLSDMNFSNITSMENFCTECTNLTTVNLSNLNISNVTNLREAFAAEYEAGPYMDNSSKLTTVCLDNLIAPKVNLVAGMFARCAHLSTDSIKSIINACLNMSSIPTEVRNFNSSLYSSPFSDTNIVINANTVGSDMMNKIAAAGWSTEYSGGGNN